MSISLQRHQWLSWSQSERTTWRWSHTRSIIFAGDRTRNERLGVSRDIHFTTKILRQRGVEPRSSAWKADIIAVIQLSLSCVFCVTQNAPRGGRHFYIPFVTGGVRTHASRDRGAWDLPLRPLGHSDIRYNLALPRPHHAEGLYHSWPILSLLGSNQRPTG